MLGAVRADGAQAARRYGSRCRAGCAQPARMGCPRTGGMAVEGERPSQLGRRVTRGQASADCRTHPEAGDEDAMLDRGHGTGQGVLSCLIACSARTEAEWLLFEEGSEAPSGLPVNGCAALPA